MQLKEREDYMQRDQNQETVEREGLVGERERNWEMRNGKWEREEIGKFETGDETGKLARLREKENRNWGKRWKGK